MHATLQPALSVGRLVGWLVGRSVTLYLFHDFYSWTSLVLHKWSSDLKYGPCPPCFHREKGKKQDRINGNPVVDGWAGAVR